MSTQCPSCKKVYDFTVPIKLCSCGWSSAQTTSTHTITIPFGPGTELTKIIPDIFKHESCGCQQYAKQMDTWGVLGCEKRFDEIVEHLLNQARKIPLVGKFQVINRCFIKKWLREAIDAASLSIVWVYWEAGAEDQELLYSMRSVTKNINGIKNLVLCGDKPDWYVGDFIHSPRVSTAYTTQVFGSSSYRKWCDSVHKLERILDNPKVTENFLWLYDDTFIVKKVTTNDLTGPFTTPNLYEGNIEVPGRTPWREVMRRTAKTLSKKGLPQRNYSTHAPIIFNKTKLKQTLEEFNVHHNPYLVESLYMNHHYKDLTTTQNFQYKMKVKAGWKIHPSSSIVNVGGFNTHVQSVIKPMFPDPIPQETSWHKSN